MSDSTGLHIGYTDGDVDTNNSNNPSLNDMIEQRLSRRAALRGGATALATAVLGGSVLTACDTPEPAANGAPTVTAGSSGATSSGRIVTLTGTATDDDAINNVAWVQTSGPAVTLSAVNTNSVTFLAPSVAAATDLVFQFAAADSKGATSTAGATVTVSPAQLGFAAVAKNKLDQITVPAGYSVQILTRLGDPIAAGVPAYANNGTDTNFAQRIGDHGDALYWYGLNAAGARDDNSSKRGLMVQNHENLNVQYLHATTPSPAPRPESEAIKEIEAHGVSVVEVVEDASRAWTYVQASAFNRRITPLTPVVFNGPVKGSAWLFTAYSPTGVAGRGTINNCANGHTLWGTNLTCEENWAGYFRRPAADDINRTPRELVALRRYGLANATASSYLWETVVPADPSNTSFARHNSIVTGGAATADFRNEVNQFGWVVEHDPYDKSLAPRKRTALGRLGHEGAWYGKFIVGKKLAVYLGDDSRGEYFYKYVSNAVWADADRTADNRLAIGDKYLDAGTLYAAKFNPDGSGVWLPLVFGSVPNRPAQGADPAYVFADQNDILVNTRLAGDAVGATRMDRPEWTATNNVTGEIYLTLTNNNASLRPLNGTDAANPRHYNDPKGASNQFGNPNGHILRLKETADDPAATTFTWDIYLFGADSAQADAANVNLSGLTADNDFSSPDGLWFSRPQNAGGLVKPILWIQTDDGAFTDVTNNQMLVAMPGTTGDGGARTITNVGTGGATATQATRVGAPPPQRPCAASSLVRSSAN